MNYQVDIRVDRVVFETLHAATVKNSPNLTSVEL